MKKNLILSAMTFATLAFVGCAQDDMVTQSDSVNNAIEFGTYLGRDAQTRAHAATLKDVQEDGFGVYAYYTFDQDFVPTNPGTPNFMNNQQVTWSNPNWTYTPVKYWPNNTGDKVTFFAYTPYNADNKAAAGSLPSVQFTVDGTVKDQQDLLYAENSNVNLTKKQLNDKVTFNFKHALSRIGFTVQGAIDQVTPGGTIDDATTITVKKVMLSGAAHTYSAGNATVSKTPAFYQNGVLNPLTGEWNSKSNANLSFTLLPANFVDEANVVLSGSQDSPTTLNNEESYLMIIPQDFTNTDMYVYIEYTVTTTDENVTGGKSEITNHISTKAPINFEAGKAYTINLVLGMNSVDITAKIAEWGNEDKQVDLPKNEETTTPTPAA